MRTGGTLLVAGLALATLQCVSGDDAVCGDGRMEGGEACDDGNDNEFDACTSACTARTGLDVVVDWSFISPEFNEGCGGIDATHVQLDVTGPTASSLRLGCGDSQHMYLALAPGEYTVAGQVWRVDLLGQLPDEAVTNVVTTPFTVTDPPSAPPPLMVPLVFAFEDFLESYTGKYYFKLRWGGVDTCAAAVPPVARHRLLLERDGAPLDGLTDAGDRIDGTSPGPCRDFADTQNVDGLPWGPAMLHIVGLDADGVARFEGSFETFVGAGVSNPVLELDVPSNAPDAGVPDAGPPDAAPADAGPVDAAPVTDA